MSPVAPLLLFVIGLLVGSFLNAWIWRTRMDISVIYGRSMCPSCRTALAWFLNIPLVSYFFLRGACHSCKEPISVQYPLVELATGLLFGAAAMFGSQWQQIARDVIAFTFLIPIFVYDLKYMQIPDRFSLVGLGALFIWQLFIVPEQILTSLLGAAIGSGFFLAQYLISQGRWVGGGDIRLGALMGFFLGAPLVLIGLMVAYIVGALSVLPALIQKKLTLKARIPFGTYLVVATVFVHFFGDPMLAWYLSFLM